MQLWAHEVSEADLRPQPRSLGAKPNPFISKSRLSPFKHDVMISIHFLRSFSCLDIECPKRTDKKTPFPTVSFLYRLYAS